MSESIKEIGKPYFTMTELPGNLTSKHTYNQRWGLCLSGQVYICVHDEGVQNRRILDFTWLAKIRSVGYSKWESSSKTPRSTNYRKEILSHSPRQQPFPPLQSPEWVVYP